MCELIVFFFLAATGKLLKYVGREMNLAIRGNIINNKTKKRKRNKIINKKSIYSICFRVFS